MNRKWVWSLLALLLVLTGIENRADAAVHIQEDMEKYVLHENMAILEDKEGELTIDEVSSPLFLQKFQLHKGGVPNYGYQKSVYWVRLEIENPLPSKEFVLEIPYAPHDSIVLYRQDHFGEYKAFASGDLLPFSERELNHRYVTYEITVPGEEVSTYYLRFESEGSLQLPLNLWEENAFSDKSLKEYLLLGLYFGATLALILYNLFLYASLRMPSYLWYVLFIIGICMTQLTLHGFAYQFFWPENPWWNNRSIVFFIALTNAAGTMFVNKFLNVRKFAPRLDYLLRTLAVLSVGVMGVLMFDYTLALDLVTVLTVFVILTALVTIVVCWKRGNKAARFLFVGWIFFLLSSLLNSLADAGILPINAFTSYGSMIGSVVEMVIFSLAFADRVKIYQLEKEKAERSALENKEKALAQLQLLNRLKDEINEELEERVKQRTIELEEKTEELLKMEESRRHLLTNISHDLRTPLTTIRGYISAMIDGLIEPTDQKYLKILHDKTLYINRLIKDLFALSVLESGQVHFYKEWIYVQDFVANFLSEFEEDVLASKIRFQLKSTLTEKDAGYMLNIDLGRIRQVMENLISNAKKHSKGLGEIVIEVLTYDDFLAVQREGKKYASEVSAAIESKVKDHSTLIIGVHDNGEGIDEKVLPYIFDRYYREISHFKNTGLGLDIAKEIIHYHDGVIWAESVKSVGSSFFFTLPLYQYETVE